MRNDNNCWVPQAWVIRRGRDSGAAIKRAGVAPGRKIEDEEGLLLMALCLGVG